MVKFLMLITSLAGGGAEKVASELSVGLSPNIQQRVVTLENNISYPTNESPISMGLTFRNPKSLSLLYNLIIGIIKYKIILNKYKPDISMSFLVLDSFINILSNIGNKNTKVIVSVHTALTMKFDNSILSVIPKYLIKIIYKRADLLIAVSEGVKYELIRDFNMNPRKVKVVFNPVDKEKIEHLAKEEIVDDQWFNEEVPIIITVGRLAKQKGQWHLIRAFSKVREKRQCRLVIRGNGDLKFYLEDLIKDFNLTNDVKFLEWNENPFKYISKASIFVFPSLWEALPYALIEAMACGCPIIATDCKFGPREILGDSEYGILIPQMDGKFYIASDPLGKQEIHLAEIIIKLLDHDNLRKWYSKKAKLGAMDFDKKKIIKEYEMLLKELIY